MQEHERRVRPFERLRERLRPPRAYDEPKNEDALSSEAPVATEWRLPKLTDLVFPKWQRELFRAILDEENLRTDREGRPRTAYRLRHTYICLRLIEGADIYQIAKNCRTSVEMIEKYYAAHIKTRLDTAAINKMRPKAKKKPKPGKRARPRRDAEEN